MRVAWPVEMCLVFVWRLGSLSLAFLLLPASLFAGSVWRGGILIEIGAGGLVLLAEPALRVVCMCYWLIGCAASFEQSSCCGVCCFAIG